MKNTSEPKLTRKQKAFADNLIANPKKPATIAAIETYGKPDKPITYRTGNSIAVENLQKPAIMAYLHGKAQIAEETMYRVMAKSEGLIEESPGYAAVAKSAASDILDRVHGKPTQKIETQSTVLQIGIDLTMLSDPTDTNTPTTP